MKNLEITSEKQRNEIQEFIQTELLKRGFLAPIKNFMEVECRNNESRFTFHTDNFQTSPVIFKEIRVEEGSSSISEKENEEKGFIFHKFYISINVRYQLFGGGSNGSDLFTVAGTLFDKKDVYDLTAF